jgi:hypothetical protein
MFHRAKKKLVRTGVRHIAECDIDTLILSLSRFMGLQLENIKTIE